MVGVLTFCKAFQWSWLNASQLPSQPVIMLFINAVYALDNWTHFVFSIVHTLISGLVWPPCGWTRVSEAPHELPGCLCVRGKQSLGDVPPLFAVIFVWLYLPEQRWRDAGMILPVSTIRAGPFFFTLRMSAGLVEAFAPGSQSETRASVSPLVQQCYCCWEFPAFLLPLTGQRMLSPSTASL